MENVWPDEEKVFIEIKINKTVICNLDRSP